MKFDLKNDRKDLYRPGSREFVDLVVPPLAYLAVDVHGDPNTTAAFPRALQTLYTGAYAIRAALKSRTGDELVVGPLEGLWSSADPAAFTARAKEEWDWTMMIPLPHPVGGDDIDRGVASAARRKPGPSPGCECFRWTKAGVCRSCTSDPMTPRARCWPACTPR